LKPCYNDDSGAIDFDANGYRLPTEAEWEYACRCGGAADGLSEGTKLADYAWYADNANGRPHPVGQKRANLWGLYDMQGNMAEWCQDIYDKDYYRGSPESNPRGPAEREGVRTEVCAARRIVDLRAAESFRPTTRAADDSGMSDVCFQKDAIGFRCVRKAPAEPK